ncbi:hypothetical protein BABINDRAFT_161335 [Babjeviella inositovora NRRL Y-12698]|uniref:Post-GPI attachment to proteins factor 3 n=1 Tax=Babjeviella inositovora NRRL Y-12698 TaxID=984486 RepID=A0A1E3QRX2_9ASCO|nr:uncharacterized protein BABINDRAFT_161335 [Babjeviella inositovora NRRL Y-12698]ODQ80388.1 hypothetical protein BABINDRAFT_161335 [Babjeviella inositovora NRRL Y-12698]
MKPLGPLLITLLLSACLASPGDDLEDFEACREDCKVLVCWNVANEQNITLETYPQLAYFSPMPLPNYLTWLRWDCELNCDYECQQIITRERIERGEEVLQFHGKWPFVRVAGIQELFSMVFSIGNFVPHFLGFRKLYHEHRNAGRLQKRMYAQIMFSSAVTMGAWICSTVFHIRDLLVTERADYYMAGATVMTGFYTITTRYYKYYLPQNWLKFSTLTFACLCLYIGHLARLMIDWSYTYNMQANVLFGILQNAVWIRHCFKLFKHYDLLEELAGLEEVEETKDMAEEKLDSVSEVGLKVETQSQLLTPPSTAPPTAAPVVSPVSITAKAKPFATARYHGLVRSPKVYTLVPVMLNSMFILGMSLEIFDFPPFWDLIDAHALWHLATIYPSWMLYDWFIWDVETNVEFEVSKIKEL